MRGEGDNDPVSEFIGKIIWHIYNIQYDNWSIICFVLFLQFIVRHIIWQCEWSDCNHCGKTTRRLRVHRMRSRPLFIDNDKIWSNISYLHWQNWSKISHLHGIQTKPTHLHCKYKSVEKYILNKVKSQMLIRKTFHSTYMFNCWVMHTSKQLKPDRPLFDRRTHAILSLPLMQKHIFYSKLAINGRRRAYTSTLFHAYFLIIIFISIRYW